MEWGGSDTTTGGAKKLSEALEEADIERSSPTRRPAPREWQEQEREEKLRKVAFMKEMPDDTPAGSVSDYVAWWRASRTSSTSSITTW